MKRIITLLALTAFASSTEAGIILFPGEMKDGAFVAGKGTYELRYSTISSEVENDKAVTTIEETVMRPESDSINAVGIVPLPDDYKDEDFHFRRAGKLLQAHRILNVDEANELYRDISKKTGNSAILTYAGRPAAVIDILPLSRKTELVTTITQTIREKDRFRTFKCPMPATKFSTAPTERVVVSVSLASESDPIHSLFCTTHHVDVERTGPKTANIQASFEKYRGQDDLKLHYVIDRDPLGVRVITHRAEGEKEGYFMLLAHPAGIEETVEKDIVFALDVSGSMRGEKMEQARSAIEYCLGQLNDGDRFNVIAFGTEVNSFRPDAVKKTKKNLEAAQDFVEELVAVGRTNIGDALKKGLAGSPKKGRLRILVFLTDGTPTSGELIPENILKQLPEMNTGKTAIYVVGVGHDVNAHLLDQIAELTEGETEYVKPEEEIDVKVAALYNRLSHPVLTEVKMDFADLNTHAVYPRKIPTLFKGGDVMVIGRYREGGSTEVTISGSLAGEPRAYRYTIDFKKEAQPENDYVATLWASRKIGFLLQEIRLHGENKELIEEVIRLSRQFGIVTEYTEFIAHAGNELSDEVLYEEAQRNIIRARSQQGGQWAVNQAANDQRLQRKTIATSRDNFFRSKRGEDQQAEKIKQVGRRVFYQREGGAWVEAEQTAPGPAAAEAPPAVREVKRFSEEYYSLIKEDKDFAKAQALGDDVSVKVGKEIINVK